jgi:CHAT domain-containing protein/Tfp pilus assembly protein PilF
MSGRRAVLVAVFLVVISLPRFIGERPFELYESSTVASDKYGPEDRQILHLIGQGRFEEALNQGRAKIRAESPGCVPYSLTVQAAVGLGELTQLTAELQEMRRIDPNNGFALVALALAFQELNQEERAWEFARDAILNGVRCEGVYRSYVELSQELGKMDVAESTVDELLEERPGDAGLLFARAYLATRRGRAHLAHEGYRNAVLKAPALPASFLEFAKLLARKGNYEQAASVCRVGLETGRDGSPEDLVRLYSTLGMVLERLGRLDDSREAFDDGLEIARAYHLGSLEASILLEQAILLGARGETSRSVEYLERARALENRVYLTRDMAINQQLLGRALAGLGQLSAAENALRECVRLSADVPDPMIQLDGKLDLGFLQLRRGERGAAIGTFNEVAHKAGQLDAAPLLSRVHSGLASAAERVGDYPSALRNYQLSLDIAEKAGRLRARVLATSNIGLVFFRLGAPARALLYSSRAAELARELGELRLEVSIQQGVAAAFAGLGNLQQSERIYRDALKKVSHLTSPGLHALILSGWARVALELGSHREAKDGFERALELAQSVGDNLVRVQALSGLGHCAWRQDDLEEAAKRFEETLMLIESTRANIKAGDERMSYQETRTQVYSSLAAVLIRRDSQHPQAGYRGKALDVVERSRARVLLDLVASAGGQPLDKVSSMRPVGNSQVASLELIQSGAIREGEILLEFLLGQPESFLWVITREDCQVVRLPSRREIETKVRSFLRTVQNPPRFPGNPFERHRELAQELFDMLVAPVGRLVTEARHIIVSPDGVLHSLPFESLVIPEGLEPGRYLLEVAPISYIPSASVLGELGQRTRRRRPELAFIGFAHPGGPLSATPITPSAAPGMPSTLSLSPIPFAVEEVRSVAQLFPAESRRTYLEEEATERAVKEASLHRFRNVHFAAHALANGMQPERSVIFLQGDSSSEDDGMLWMGEVLNLRLASELVVLSGCQTGLGQVLNAEGTVGLSWAFLSAGSSSVVVSLWNVNDRSTSELMLAFYREMGRGLGRSDALRRAKQFALQSERKAFRHPYYWAPFILIGQSN